ncbi:hypothetical protein Tco_0925385 [Tanacetum coccineum]|uniref:Uncharacterized protein n=1 Tax=Tanacetum coccineum TaxID=301880 RepID=A0ABQ5D9N3_9ASTR
MLLMEDIGIFNDAYADRDEGVEADFNNLELTTVVSPIPPSKIHKDHPKDQIIGELHSATQTRGMSKKSARENAMIKPKKCDSSPWKISKLDMGTCRKNLHMKIASTPLEPNKPLLKDEEAAAVDVHLYRSMIGSLMYLTASRPNIMFAVCNYDRFQVSPKTSHLHAVKRIFRYLKGQPKLGLWKSTTGGCQFLGRRLISWQCKKQTIVATSTTEAEYVAATNCCGQVLWIQNQMLDYGFNFMNTRIFIDNESTICIVKNPLFHSKTKHIEIRHHFIRDSYEKRLIQVLKIHTDHNVADLFTKGLMLAVDYTQVLFGLHLKGNYDDQLLNTDGLSFYYLKKLCTAGTKSLYC